MTTQQAETLIDQVAAAWQAGNRAKAQRMLMQAIQLDNNNERAWLLLSEVVEEDDKRRHCLQQVQRIKSRSTFADGEMSPRLHATPDAPPDHIPTTATLVGKGDRWSFDPREKIRNRSDIFMLITMGGAFLLSGLVLVGIVVLGPVGQSGNVGRMLGAVVVVLAILGMGGFLLRVGLQGARMRKRVLTEGRTAEALVISKKHLDPDEDTTKHTYTLTFEYDAVGDDGSTTRCAQSKNVKQQQYEQVAVGGSVRVRYLPDAPLAVLLEA